LVGVFTRDGVLVASVAQEGADQNPGLTGEPVLERAAPAVPDTPVARTPYVDSSPRALRVHSPAGTVLCLTGDAIGRKRDNRRGRRARV
jgi:hypothetical protein